VRTGHQAGRPIPLVVWIAIFSAITISVDQGVSGVAYAQITKDLGGAELWSWGSIFFLLGSVIATPLSAMFSDVFGHRRTFAWAAVGSIVGVLAVSASLTMPNFILAKFVQGFSVGIMVALAQIALAEEVSPSERARNQGFVVTCYGLASILAPSLGGFILEHASWRIAYLATSAVPAIPLLLHAFKKTVARPPHDGHVSLRSIVWFVTSIGGLVIGVAAMKLNPEIGLSLFALSAVALALYIRSEINRPAQLIPFSLMRNQKYRAGVALAFLVPAAMQGVMLLVPLYLQLAAGMTPAKVGMIMLWQVIPWLVAAAIGGQAASRFGISLPLVRIGIFAEICGIALAMSYFVQGAPVPCLYAGLAVMGVGMGLALPNVVAWSQSQIVRHYLGKGTATLGLSRALGGLVGVTLVGVFTTIFAAGSAGAPGKAAGIGPHVAYDGIYVSLALITLAFLVSLGVKSSRLAPMEEH
jgi:MFS family permease